jgi:hypothetical protein
MALYNEKIFKTRFTREFQSGELYFKEDKLAEMTSYFTHITGTPPTYHSTDNSGTWSPVLKRPQRYIDVSTRHHDKTKADPTLRAVYRAQSYASQINNGNITSPSPEMIEHHQVVYDPVLEQWRVALPGEWDAPA